MYYTYTSVGDRILCVVCVMFTMFLDWLYFRYSISVESVSGAEVSVVPRGSTLLNYLIRIFVVLNGIAAVPIHPPIVASWN